MDNRFAKKFFKAFSLTENLTVIFVMGLIIGITIPNMVKQRNTKNNKIAVRKAVMSYHGILRKSLVSSTGIRTTNDLNSIIKPSGDSTCETIKSNFIISSQTGCNFVTSDGIRWNVTNPDKVIIGLKNKSLAANSQYNDLTETNAKDNSNFKVFAIPYNINDGNIQMLSSSDNNLNDAITKTKNFITGE